MWLAYEAFMKKYDPSVFDTFWSPEGINPLLFAPLCVYSYTDACKAQTSHIRVGTDIYGQNTVNLAKKRSLNNRKL